MVWLLQGPSNRLALDLLYPRDSHSQLVSEAPEPRQNIVQTISRPELVRKGFARRFDSQWKQYDSDEKRDARQSDRNTQRVEMTHSRAHQETESRPHKPSDITCE